MKYLEYYNLILGLKNEAMVLFMDFRYMDKDDPDRDQIEDQLTELNEKIVLWEDVMYAKYDCGVDRIMCENKKTFQESQKEYDYARNLWHSFDSSSAIMLVQHPVICGMLVNSPKWFFHLKEPGIGEIHKNDILPDLQINTIDEGGEITIDQLDYLVDAAKEKALKDINGLWITRVHFKTAHVFIKKSNHSYISLCGGAEIYSLQKSFFNTYTSKPKCKGCMKSKYYKRIEREA